MRESRRPILIDDHEAFSGALRELVRARYPLPDHEHITYEVVGDKPWSGYNYYQGNSQSKIEINADFPIYTERAIDLGCHEGYPGHHVYNALLEKTFVDERGWVEMSVYPLFSPMSFVAEGSANYGIDLAFPGDEGTDFEREVLFRRAAVEASQRGTPAPFSLRAGLIVEMLAFHERARQWTSIDLARAYFALKDFDRAKLERHRDLIREIEVAP